MSRLLVTSEIINNIWAIHPRVAMAHLPTIAQIIKGDKADFSELKAIREENEKLNAPKYALISEEKSAGSFKINYARQLQDVPEGSIVIISYTGVVRMQSGLSNKGTEETRNELAIAGQNPNIKAVLFKGHSGGGSVFGTESLSNDIKNFEKNYSKPIAAIAEDQACSAMYWIMSGAPMIFGSGKSCEIGCIGTMSSFYDYSEFFEKEGIKEIIVRATKSFNKNEEYYQAVQGNIAPLQKNILDPLNDAFLSTVKQNRKGKINLDKIVTNDEGVEVAEALSGKTYYGQQAVRAGLIDKIGTTNDALAYLAREAKKYKTVKNTKTNTMVLKNYTQLNDAALTSEIANLEASMPLNTESNYEERQTLLDLAQSVQARRAADVENTRLSGELVTATEDNNSDALQTSLDTATGERDAANATIETRDATIVDQTSQIDTLTTERDDALASSATANDSLTAEQGKLTASEKKVTAFETFVEAEYGADAVMAFVADANGDIKQPEAIDTKIVYRSRTERAQDNFAEATKMIEGAEKKKKEANK